MAINERIRKIVKDVLNEELGINSYVYTISQKILNFLKRDIIKREKIPIPQYQGYLRNGVISFQFVDHEVKIFYKNYDFISYEDCQNFLKNNYEICNASSYVSNDLLNNTIEINLLTLKGNFSPIVFEELQHELNHIFQQLMSNKKYKKGLIRLKRDKFQNNILRNGEVEDKYLKSANFILYMSQKFEQDSFINGLYSLLMNTTGDISQRLNQSGIIHNLKSLSNDIEILNTLKGEPHSEFKNTFGIPLREIIYRGKYTKKKLIKSINQLIFKYGKDTGQEVRNCFIQ